MTKLQQWLSCGPHSIVFGTLAATAAAAAAQVAHAAPPATGGDLVARLDARLRAYHDGAPDNGEALRVVYFYPGDAEPQAAYRERLTRIMEDVQEFYHTEMTRHGFTAPAMALERDGDQVMLHVVEGQDKSDAYTYENGGKVRWEVAKALAREVDLKNDFVLVVGGMCQKRGERNYFFHAPYYGDAGSGVQWGLCYVADCELMDTLNLTDTKNEIVFEEHYYKEKRMTVALFNSWYLGGLAHELGHGLSLPHNGAWRDEEQQRGRALMGWGNHTYRNDLWGGGKGDHMTLASALRLAAHPLFTRSDRGRDIEPAARLEKFEAAADGKNLRLSGALEAEPEALAVIAYTDPEGGAGYDAKTWVSEVVDGRFEMDAERHRPGDHEIRLTVLHINGATSQVLDGRYRADQDGIPDAAAIEDGRSLRLVERAFVDGHVKAAAAQARATLDAGGVSDRAKAKLEHIIALANAPTPVTLDETEGGSAQLATAAWESAEVGWGEPARGHYHFDENIKGQLFLELGGQFFPGGLYAHAPSKFAYRLGGEWKTFRSTAGLQDGAGPSPRGRFVVLGDGKVLFRSEPVADGSPVGVAVDVSGVDLLELVVEPAPPVGAPPGMPATARCWTVWGDPIVER